jgi:hypothetical protein
MSSPHIDRTAGQQVTSLQKFFEDLVPVPLAVQSVNNDACIEKVGGHVSGLPLSESAFRPAGATCPPTWLLPTAQELQYEFVLCSRFLSISDL